MKILGWMQNKFNPRVGSKNLHSVSVINHDAAGQQTRNEEFSDWPHGLLAIGTFGNTKSIKEEDSKPKFIQEFTLEEEEEKEEKEVEKLENELNSFLHKQQGTTCDTELNNLVNQNGSNPSLGDDSKNNDQEDCPLHGIVVGGGGKGLCMDNSSNCINKKSLSFLLKKIFICRGGFAPTLTFSDQVPESRMEKILKAILHKKIYPQNPNSTSCTKKFLENKHKLTSSASEEVKDDKDNKGSKWVKTDSEYIVLEI